MVERFAPHLKLAANEKFSSYINGNFVTPIDIEISLVGFCNAKCSWCFYKDNTDKEFLTTYSLYNLFTEMCGNDIPACVFTGGGEPTLHPDFDLITWDAFNCGIKQGLITNGTLKIYKDGKRYDPTYFEWIRVSLTEKWWDIENLKYLRNCKVLGMNINYLGKQQDDDVKRSLEIAYKVNADYLEIRPALELNGKTTQIDVPEIDDPKLKKIRYKFKECKIPHGTNYNKCQGYHFTPFLWHNGNVSVCAYHKGNPRFILGNLYKESLMDIMKRAPQYIEIVETCQTCCKNHEINKLINEVQNLTDKDFV